jgi:phosphatidylinositol glycan class B
MPTVTRLFTNSDSTVLDYITLVREAFFCGGIVLAVSGASDFYYFGEWTFPPYQWLNFNISQNLAVFYGRNDWHYFLSQGLPLLLTTYLPFTLVALFQATSLPPSDIRFLLTTTIFTATSTLSLISHKEVRFIYPLLPLLHILTAPVITSFFQTTATKTTHPPPFPSTPRTVTITILHRKKLLALILALNISIAAYTSAFHQSGVISVTKFLRTEYEALALDGRGRLMSHPDASKDDHVKKYTNYDDDETFVGFLMPCHSTPWRSQLIYPGLKAWALSCEPPIHLAPHSVERENYRDEGDRFYDNPIKFLREEINTKEKPWPRYIVGFEGIQDVLKEYYEAEMGEGFVVKERWRTKNSHWHDDERRTGDVLVWEFLDGSQSEGSNA